MCWTPDDGVTVRHEHIDRGAATDNAGDSLNHGFPIKHHVGVGSLSEQGLFFPRTGKVNVSGNGCHLGKRSVLQSGPGGRIAVLHCRSFSLCIELLHHRFDAEHQRLDHGGIQFYP